MQIWDRYHWHVWNSILFNLKKSVSHVRKNEKTAAPLSKYPKKKIRLQHSVDSDNNTRIKQHQQQPQQQKKECEK